MTTTTAIMHNADGSDSNAVIKATLAEVLEARETLLRIHSTIHTRGQFGVPQDPTRGWTEACSCQAEAQGIVHRFPGEFPAAIVEALRVAEANGLRAMQLLFALTLPRRKRRKGHKGVFFTEASA